MNFDRILSSSPINQTAARVVSRRRGLEQPEYLTREELVGILDRLTRKLRLLKVVLLIDTKAKHHNLIEKAKRGISTYRGAANPRSVSEYLRVGHEIQRMNRKLQDIRAEKSGKRIGKGGWIE